MRGYQNEVLYVIKPKGKCTLSRDEIQPEGLMIYKVLGVVPVRIQRQLYSPLANITEAHFLTECASSVAFYYIIFILQIL